MSMPNDELATSASDKFPSGLSLLEYFSLAANGTFDRILAARALGEAVRESAGDDWQSWAHLLIESGESLNLRIRLLEAPIADALTLVRQGIPVATCVTNGEQSSSWIVISRMRGKRILVHRLGLDGGETWMRSSKLKGVLGRANQKESVSWLIGQPALSCQSDTPPAEAGEAHSPMKPFARLLRFIRPESRDLWILFVFSLVTGILALATPIAVEALVNTVAFGRYLQPIVVLAILLFTFLAFAAAIRALIAYVAEIIQRRMFIKVVADLAHRLPRAKISAFDKVHGPELTNRFFDIVTVQKAIAALLLDGITIVLQTVIGMTVIAFYHPFLLGYNVVLLCLIGVIVFGLGRGAVKTSIKESKYKYAIAAWLQELSRHVTTFRMTGGKRLALDQADHLAIEWLDARRVHFRILMRQILFALGLQAVAATVLLGIGGWLVIQGELTLGQLVAAELIVTIIIGSFAKLGKQLESFYDLMAAIDKLGYLFDLPTESSDKLLHLQATGPAGMTACNVSVSLGGRSVLKDFSLEVEPGASIALMGPPGCGKSTLIELLSGLRRPDSGYIEIDGMDLREIRSDSLREHVAVIPKVEIFAGTIEENIHLDRPDLTGRDVKDALTSVGLLEELLKFPEGLSAKLQTDGNQLSASQRARLMIARAIIGKPRLLLVDNLLDGLPDDIQAQVLASLCYEKAPWTLIVATGKSSVSRACSTIIEVVEAQHSQHPWNGNSQINFGNPDKF